MATCDRCTRNPATAPVTLIRLNATGMDGVWRCVDCLDAPPPGQAADTLEALRELGLLAPRGEA